ncbi:class C beta-lactamase-related serine hydrolase [Halopseudomonas pelagia]|uniref:6-aminohexanoate hydrolase n=2 Tax=Halopseudomonas pelagia TaxID=553151 RepID=A0AA91U0C5_9GAMM|nr:6-aminohexanoate hydrolase [Halopseudomonas pelagia]QFY58831.1 class C beta-lactamase-related serine hydrolase [Halopseudomonas pelagia]
MLLGVALLTCSAIQPADASTEAESSSIMQGFPPDPERRVTKANAFIPPYLRWSMTHARELSPTRNLARAKTPMSLPAGPPIDLDGMTFKVAEEPITLNRYLQESMTNGLIVMHRGQVVYERYLDGFSERQPHIWASMTKSVTGLLAAQFIAEGKLDPQARLASYVPELEGTPFGESSVRFNLDMMVPVAYPENVPPDLGLFAATGLIPRRPGMPEDIYSFLKMAYSDGDSGQQARFFYQNGSPEALAWALRRISGKSWAELVEKRIWSRFAEEDAYVQIDQLGTEMASGGISSNLRDTARFAELVRLELNREKSEDSFNQAVHSLADPGDPAVFAGGNLAAGRPGYSYRNYWFQKNDGDNSIEASGRFGQKIYINPKRELVIVQLATTPDRAKRASSASAEDRVDTSAIGSAATFNNLVSAVHGQLPHRPH